MLSSEQFPSAVDKRPLIGRSFSFKSKFANPHKRNHLGQDRFDGFALGIGSAIGEVKECSAAKEYLPAL